MESLTLRGIWYDHKCVKRINSNFSDSKQRRVGMNGP